MAQRCQKYASPGKKLNIKVVRNRISSEKVRERICLSPRRGELGGSKDWYGWKIILHRSGRKHSFKGSTLSKIHIIWKKALNKSFSEFNSFEAPSSPLGGRYTYALSYFFEWNSILNNIYFKLFFMWYIFLAAIKAIKWI